MHHGTLWTQQSKCIPSLHIMLNFQRNIDSYFPRSPLFTLQLESALRTLFAEEGSSLLASHRKTILLQSSILVEFSGILTIPSMAIFLAASRIAFWQTCWQHSLTGSTFPQAVKIFEESTMLSNLLASTTGQEASVRFAGWIEHIVLRFRFAPWVSKIFSKSERQCWAFVVFKLSIPEYLPYCPIRITMVASNWGQHTTLAKYGAKEAQQSVAVVLTKLSAAEKFNVHKPERYNKISHSWTIYQYRGAVNSQLQESKGILKAKAF